MASSWKDAEEAEHRDFLYVEEINSSDGESKRLTGIPTSQTVEYLKRTIASELRSPQSWSQIMLVYVDRELSDLNASLSSYHIQDGDTIFFTRAVTPARPAPRDVPPPYSGPKTLNNVMFRHFDGKTLILHGIPLTWKVKQLRQKLGQEKSLDVEDLRFIWSGKQFQDDKTLESYGLVEDCTIHIVMRLPGGA